MSHYTTFEERLEIENGLRENLSFGEIAGRLSKDRSTISREVKNHAFDISNLHSVYDYCTSFFKCGNADYI